MAPYDLYKQTKFGTVNFELLRITPSIFGYFEDFFFFLSLFCDFFHTFDHISGTTDPIGLKFLVSADFGHWVPRTNL